MQVRETQLNKDKCITPTHVLKFLYHSEACEPIPSVTGQTRFSQLFKVLVQRQQSTNYNLSTSLFQRCVFYAGMQSLAIAKHNACHGLYQTEDEQ